MSTKHTEALDARHLLSGKWIASSGEVRLSRVVPPAAGWVASIAIRDISDAGMRGRVVDAVDANRELEGIPRERANEYAGQWILLREDRILAHGSFNEVWEEAERLGIQIPRIVRVAPEPDQGQHFVGL